MLFRIRDRTGDKMTKDKQLRCIHRHTIDEHPRCFKKGLVKANVKDEKRWSKVTGEPWYRFPEYKVCYLDIESDGLKADFSTMLSWAIKEKGGPVLYRAITKKELFRERNVDKELIESLLDTLANYRIVVTYFGTMFDIPYIRAKALHYGMDFPEYGELYHHDLYYLVKSKLNLSRKSLDNVCDYLGIVGKTPLGKETWRLAKYGNKTALDNVILHNVGDVEILEELHNKLEPYRKWIKTSI